MFNPSHTTRRAEQGARRSGLRRPVALLAGVAGIIGVSVACEPVAQVPFTWRTNAASTTYVTPAGVTFNADAGFVGGSASGASGADIAGTTADKLYNSHRWGMTGYRVTVPAAQTYKVRMHFAETVFSQPGKRVFDVTAEGAVKLNDLDVARTAGPNQALVREFDVQVTDGRLDIGFGRVIEDPMVSAIEVINTGTTTTPTTPPTTPPTTTPPTTPPTTTPPTTPPATGRPTSTNTGPTVANPQRLGRVDVRGPVSLNNVIVSEIFVHAGGQLTATNVRVENSVVVLPQVGAAKSKIHMTNSAIHRGMTVNVVDGSGNLYWGSEVPVDLVFDDTWIFAEQGNAANGDHTEALAGFGWPQGAVFRNSTLVQQGPFNGTATAVMNWHGTDTVFDNVWFDWDGGIAAYYTVYVEGRNNVVRNSTLVAASGSYVYPSSSPRATYSGNRDLATGKAITLS